jgi:hypothetical protein
MASLVVDSTAVDAGNTALTLTAGAYSIRDIAAPTPDVDPRFVTQNQADGDRLEGLRYLNREITLTINVNAASAAALESAMNALTMKWAKLNREGGTITVTAPTGTVKTVYVLTAPQITPSTDIAYLDANYRQVTASVLCEPFARGAETSYSSHAETTLPHVVFTEVDVPGDVPALGRLEITDASANDQAWAVWGLQSRHYSNDADAALFYEAEGRTALGTAAIATVTGASGGVSNNAVTEGSLTDSYVAMLSTQATGGGNHLEHIGGFRILARCLRPTANTGAVTVALEWSDGDFRRWTRNAPVAYAVGEREGAFTIADLGTVSLPKALSGSQRWEGRIVAKSTVVGDDLSVDCLWLIPVDEGWGELTAVSQVASPTSVTARDSFEQSAGALTAKALPVGGTWAGAGDADDFAINTSADTADRTAVSDTATSIANGRLVTANGTSAATAITVSVKTTSSNYHARRGVIARYVDASNFLAGYFYIESGQVEIVKVIAGTATVLGAVAFPDDMIYEEVRVEMSVGNGGVILRLYGVNASVDDRLIATVEAYDAVLVSGGTLDNGYVGFVDWLPNANAGTRAYNDFIAAPFTIDAAIFASQSAQVRWDGAIREDSAGAIYVPVSRYEGDRLLVPPEGPESRSVRFITKASRNHPDTGTDSGIDDYTARLHITPRYLAFP